MVSIIQIKHFRIFLIILFLVIFFASGASSVTARTVCPVGCDHTNIQAAINAANIDEIINVGEGTYLENVNINKRVKLIGAGSELVIINAANPNDHVFDVQVSGVELSGFKIMGTVFDYAGIYIGSKSNNYISNNNVSNNYHGIWVNINSNNNRIINNIIMGNFMGICVTDNSNYNNLSGNIVGTSSYGGVMTWNSNNNDFIGNDVSFNMGTGIMFTTSSNNKLKNNIVNSNEYDGISISGGINNNLTGNTVNSNVNGISIYDSSSNILMSNTFNSNNYGVYLSNSNSNSLNGNNINSNSINGIYLCDSSGSSIFGNVFNNNLNFGFGCSVYSNYWNSTQSPNFGGNFWGDLAGRGFSRTCIDANMDGFCDSNYTLASGNIDFHPMASPTGYINGTILNGSTGIAGAVVRTNTGVSSGTDSSGLYSIPVPAGSYNLIVTMEPEYVPDSSVTADVNSGETTFRNIQLNKKPVGTISGIAQTE